MTDRLVGGGGLGGVAWRHSEGTRPTIGPAFVLTEQYQRWENGGFITRSACGKPLNSSLEE